MNAEQPESRFERWWWRAWYLFVALALVWLAWCGWLATPAASWTQGWVGWWTGDRMGSRPLSHFHSRPHEGSEVAPVDGNPAFRTGDAGEVGLGHWREDGITWTWAGWVRITSPTGTWPTNFLVVRAALSPDFEMRLGFEAGRPRASLGFQVTEGERSSWTHQHLASNEPLPLGQWIHLAISTDRILHRLVVNGEPVMEHRAYLSRSIRLASLRLVGGAYYPASDAFPKCEVEHDDVVAFDRVVSGEELAGLAARGRGGWLPEQERPARAARAWTRGWPLALLTLAGMIALKLLRGARRRLAHTIGVLTQPGFRSVRWTLGVGLAVSMVLSVSVGRQSRRADEQRFEESLYLLRRDTDIYWERVASLLFRAKDWIATQTNLSQSAWEDWLSSNHFPHDYSGVIGVGYAEQVQAGQRSAHEAKWSERHGFAFRIRPGPHEDRQPVRELAGEPHLPVVLYSPRALDRQLWFTNHSILGRDLLFQSREDRRSWAEARRVGVAVARNEIASSSLEEIAPGGWYGQAVQGIRMYLPWTLRTKIHHREALEPSGWRGALFASVDLRALLRARFAKGTSPLGLRMFTGSPSGERFDLVADSADFLAESADHPKAYMRRTLEIPFYYRRLFIDVWTTAAFEAQSMRRWSWIAGAAGGGFTLLVATLLFVQVRAREAQGRVMEALRAANSELLLTYRDRERLSRDLHDGSIQNLYGLGLHLQRVQTLLAASPNQAREELNDSLAMLDQSIAELRQFILTAGVDSLQQHTAASALEGLVDRLRKTTPIDIQLHLDEQAAGLDPRAGVQVLNIVREAVSNAVRHAGARRIDVRLAKTPALPGETNTTWTVSISDDGCGFDRKQVNGHGRGLKNLMARAAELGGRSEISSRPGEGTRVVVEFAVTPQTTAGAYPGDSSVERIPLP